MKYEVCIKGTSEDIIFDDFITYHVDDDGYKFVWEDGEYILIHRRDMIYIKVINEKK